MPPARIPEFFAQATRLQFLNEPQSQALASEAARLEREPGALALEKAALSPVQVSIVETLLQPDTAVPGYEVLDLLGFGGMGVVYRARQKNLDRPVALKTVLISQMSRPEAAERFEQEAMAVARLRHPAIVGAYDFGRHEGRLYFAMEFVEGTDAEQLAGRLGSLPEASVWHVIRQAASGLMHARQHGVVHRDIKPANLLLLHPPEGLPLPAGVPMVKITDFGLAFLTEEGEQRTRLTAVDSALGSPHYMAPEQLGNATVDHRADMYALGATAWHLLAGEPPFRGNGLPQVLAAKLGHPAPRLDLECPSISSASADLVAALLIREPDERLSDYAELLRRIDQLLAELESGNSSGTLRTPQPGPQLLESLSSETASSADAQLAPTISTPVPLTPVDGSRPFPADTGPEDVREAETARSQSLWRTARRLVTGWRLRTAVIVCFLLAIAATWRLEQRTAEVPRRITMLPGAAAGLFDGESLAGWSLRHLSGRWMPSTDDEGGRILSGSDGRILRPLAGTVNQPWFRVSVAVRYNRAESVLIGLTGRNGETVGARLTAAGIEPGRIEADGTWQSAGETVPDPLMSEGGTVIVGVERQPQGWWVLRNDSPIGYIGPSKADTREPGALLLQVQGGPAWFADLVVESLIAPTPSD